MLVKSPRKSAIGERAISNDDTRLLTKAAQEGGAGVQRGLEVQQGRGAAARSQPAELDHG